MTRRPLIGAAASAALSLALVACGGTASPTPATSAAPLLPSAQPSVEAPSVAPSPAAPSESATTGGQPSGAPASGGADSEALKAQLPDTICGKTATKQALTGDQLSTIGGSQMVQALAALGKLSNNLALAVAATPDGGCTLGLLQIKGIDTTLLESAMTIAASQAGTTATQVTVGGKDAWKTTNGDTTTYVVFGGENVIFATAKSDADAQSMIEALP